MTGNGGQRGRNNRPNRPSARLALGPEDSWRSWSQLPADEAVDTDADPDGDVEVEAADDVEQMAAKLGGSMLIVGGADPGPGSPVAAGSTPVPTEVPPTTATPTASAPTPAPAPPAAAPVATQPTAAARPASTLPQRPKPDLPPPATTAPPGPEASGGEAVAAKPAVSPADGDAALAAGMSGFEASYEAASAGPPPAVAAKPAPRRLKPNPAPSATAVNPTSVNPTAGSPVVNPAAVNPAAVPAAVRPAVPLAIFAPNPASPASPPSPASGPLGVSAPEEARATPDRPARRDDDDVAFVLLSDPEMEAAASPPRRRPATPAKPRKGASRPNPFTASWAETAEEPRSISGLVAEAVGLLEERVAKQAEETEALLLELDARHAEELARLDGRVLRELKGIERGVPKSFEDRIHASFMQVVERLEQLERRPATSTAGAPGASGVRLAAVAPAAATTEPATPSPNAGLDAAIAYVMEQHGRLAATVEEVADRQRGVVTHHEALVTEHQALAEQNIALAEAQQLVVAGQQRVNEQLESALHRISELTQQIGGLGAALPEVERRVVGLEGQLGESLALLRAQVSDLSERFPAVEGAVEVAQRHADALVDLRGTVEQFRAALDHDVSQVRDRLGELDGLRDHVAGVQQQSERIATDFGQAVGRLDELDERVAQTAAASETLHADFLRLQAETDRRSSDTEARVLDLEDVIGGEVGVERNLLLDRIEEMERGLYELNPDQFVRRDDRSGPTHQPDGPPDSGPGR